jgi:hypothetical protein
VTKPKLELSMMIRVAAECRLSFVGGKDSHGWRPDAKPGEPCMCGMKRKPRASKSAEKK